MIDNIKTRTQPPQASASTNSATRAVSSIVDGVSQEIGRTSSDEATPEKLPDEEIPQAQTDDGPENQIRERRACQYIPPSRRSLPGPLDSRQCGRAATHQIIDSGHVTLVACARHAAGYKAKFRRQSPQWRELMALPLVARYPAPVPPRVARGQGSGPQAPARRAPPARLGSRR